MATDQIPQVALAFMNDDHHEAVELMNGLNEALQDGEDEQIDELLASFLDHNRSHFGREEQHMRDYGFPAYPVHKGEHERVLAEMDQMANYWLTRRDRGHLQRYLTETVLPWFNNHLATMDTMTAMFVARQMG
ncbi:hemerythrin family protein [Marinobacterium sp. CAU 1594]|nr:hemerythrin family protein [Marinobacterium arenosum]